MFERVYHENKRDDAEIHVGDEFRGAEMNVNRNEGRNSRLSSIDP